jgi:hypothetical protein
MLRETFHPKAALPDVRICENCGLGKLELVDERPHPVLGIAGKTLRTLRCNAGHCGTYLIESN